MKKRSKKHSLRYLIFTIIVLIAGAGAFFLIPTRSAPSASAAAYKTEAENDPYVRFVMEAYDKILINYWKKIDDAALAPHFRASLQKALAAETQPELLTPNREGVANMLAGALVLATSTERKKEIAKNTLVVALYNLYPLGRSGLFSDAQEKDLRQQVANVNPDKDLYQDLGVAKGASASEIKLAYDKKAAELAKMKTPEAEQELKKLAYAKSVLTDPDTKDLYEQAKIEPTASHKILGKTLYVKIDKVAPTTLIEFGRTLVTASSTKGLNSLIIDLRGNLGGALDFASNFLGFFLGPNQYAFDLFHQDEYRAQRTAQPRFPLLDRYEEVAVLTDGMSQSSAEVTAAAFKRFRLGTVIGKKTRGWGTVENTFPLESTIDPKEKYALFLVHSLTLRDDGQPIEGNGVDPNVDLSRKDWKAALSKQIRSKDLISAVMKVI